MSRTDGIKEGDFVFYYNDGDRSAICVGLVIGVYPEEPIEVRTDTNGMQVPIGVSFRKDWVWQDGKYALPRYFP